MSGCCGCGLDVRVRNRNLWGDIKVELTYRKAVKDDADLLIDIYNFSFYDDYIFYGECPGYGQTKEHMEQSIEDFTKYIVLKDNIPVGVLSFKDEGDGHYYLGCLCVIPEYQGMGIGTKTFQYMLSVCPNWKEIHLLTPVDKKQNIKFYTEKCGFNIGKKVMDEKVEVINFYLNR